MNLFKLYFSWKGEISRLPYFLAYLALSVVSAIVMISAILFLLGIGVMSGSRAGFVGSMLLWIALAIPIFLLFSYCNSVLIVKRLHDIGWSGKHIFWIYGLGFVASILSNSTNIFVQITCMILYLFLFGVYMWLLFIPGEGSAFSQNSLRETFR